MVNDPTGIYHCKKCFHYSPLTADEKIGYSADSMPVGFCDFMESTINQGEDRGKDRNESCWNIPTNDGEVQK